jgi:hypothetical protein
MIDDRPAEAHGADDAMARRSEAEEPPLNVTDLRVTVRSGSTETRILRGVSFAVLRGQMLALIGGVRRRKVDVRARDHGGCFRRVRRPKDPSAWVVGS